jgi:hypothetical protein
MSVKRRASSDMATPAPPKKRRVIVSFPPLPLLLLIILSSSPSPLPPLPSHSRQGPRLLPGRNHRITHHGSFKYHHARHDAAVDCAAGCQSIGCRAYAQGCPLLEQPFGPQEQCYALRPLQPQLQEPVPLRPKFG